MVATTALLTAVISVLNPMSASAAGTILFQNAFNNRTVDGVGSVVVPTPTSGTNTVCLTASGNSATRPLFSCAGASDPQGSGKLRLTATGTNLIGGVFGETSFPTSNGLDVTFNSYQWGGNGGDGMSFLLAAVNPTNPAAPTTIGPTGGSLGYSPAGTIKGLPNAYLGVGLDVFGNFSNPTFQGTGCPTVPNLTTTVPGAVVVRGPGTNSAGYCGLTTTYTGTPASRIPLRAPTRAGSVVPVQVLINPTATAFTSTTGVTVDPKTYKVVVTPVGQAVRTLAGPLPSVSPTLYPSSSWLNADGVPRQLAFAFVGSTGSVIDTHEASDVKVLTFNPVAQLGVASTSYTAANPAPGAPVTYTITPSVQVGTDEAAPISMTQTTPSGVVPVGAYGTGWVCQTPVGQTVTCTTSASTFANGTTLPVITVVGIVTSASMSAAIVQNSSVARVSSADANPDTVTVTTPGTLPTTPSAVTASPAIGPVSGGDSVTLTGTNTDDATAVEIGTTAEQAAATPVVLLPCPGGVAATGCFTQSGTVITISSMPARTAASAVSITVVTSGLASAAAYTYASAPATLAAPAATAGVTSATTTWVAPANNGSAITSYTVTPYLGTVAGTPVEVGPTVLSRTFTGLTVGGSYTFVVTATNAYGTSPASPKSAVAVPYTVPGPPTITAATAGDSSAVLTWTTPSNGSSAITGYVVTPYVNNVAQTPRNFTGAGTTQTVTALTPGTSYTFTVAAQNAAGTGAPSTRSGAVVPNVSPTLTFPAPPSGQVGVPYSRQLTVTNGTSPFTWSVTAGSLPPGITLGASTGLLSGTPTTAGTSTFTVQIVDASGQTASKAVTLVIAATPILSFTPAPGEVSVAFAQQPTVSGGTGPFAWAISAGGLPPGVGIDAATGAITGTPTAAGNFAVTVAATDAFGQVASTTVTIIIVALPTFTFATPPPAQVGVAYSISLDVAGGTLPLTWSTTAGALPPGLSLGASTGMLTGTPTTTGTSAFRVTVVDANGKSTSRSVSLVTSVGPIVIVKSADVSSVAAGGVVTYTITATNTGSAAVPNVALADLLSGVLDDAAYNADATATSGAVSYSSSTVNWSGTIAAGATVTITYGVTVTNPVTGNRILTNTVTSSTLGTNCAAGGTDARCTSTVTVPGLSIVKTADAATATPGQVVHYSIVVTNTGQTAYAPAALADNLAGVLDDANYNLDGASTSGNVSYSGQVLNWSGPLAVGASVTVTYSITVSNPDAGDRTLRNTVVSSSAGTPCPAVSPAAQCTSTVPVLVPALAIATTADPAATTTPGATVAYTTTISNTGQTAYPAGTSVVLALDEALDDATYDGDVTLSGGGTAVYDATAKTITWTGALPIGAEVTVTASVTVLPNGTGTGDGVLSTSTTSSAPGSTCLPGGSGPACATTVQVRVPAVTVSTSADGATTTPGSVVRYTLTAVNSGQTPQNGITVANQLAGVVDDATYSNDASASSGDTSFTGSTLEWTGNLAVGATVTITYTVTVHDPDTGDFALLSTVSTTAAGANCPVDGSDPACATRVDVLVPGLSFSSSFDTATTSPGSVVNYTATVTNTGQTAYNALPVTLDLAGALDDATYNFDAAATAGGLNLDANGDLTWTLSLAPGGSATASLSLSLTVADPDTGDRSLVIRTSSVAAGSTCPPLSANTGCAASVTVLVPGLVISKTANTSTVSPGATVEYTIQITNTGETTYTDAAVDDHLATVLTDASFDPADASASTGILAYVSTVLTWTGTLAPGESATVSYPVEVLDPAPGDKRLINTVSSAAPGNNCPTGSTDSRCTSTVDVLVPSLTIVKTADAVTTVPGANVGYTVTVTNSGPTAYTAATVTDSLSGVLDDAAYNDDLSTDTGSASYAASAVSWTGALSPGAVATITYSVLVNVAPGGDNLLANTAVSGTAGSTCPAGAGDARCTSSIPIARLLLEQSFSQASATPGSTVTLTATFTNTGTVPLTGISVSTLRADSSDDAVPVGDQTASSGTLSLTASAITWTGSIPVGGVVTITGGVRIIDPPTGNRDVTGTLQSSAPGNNCPVGGSDARCTSHLAVVVPGLTITTAASSSTAVPGAIVGYTITLVNTGQTPYASADLTAALAGVLDDAAYNGDATATAGAVDYAAPSLTWQGPIAVGGTVTISYSVTLNDPVSGDKTMITSISSASVGSSCAPASGSAACRTTVVVLTPGLTIVKTADAHNATLGTEVDYTVVVTNSGQTPYGAAAFTDSLAGVLDDAAYVPASLQATSGTVDYSVGTITWSGSLAPTASATITYSVVIDNPSSGDHSLSNTVVSSNTGSNCAEAGVDSRCTAVVAVTDSVSLTFDKTADVQSTVAGAVVVYTVTVTNSSASTIPAEFTDPLADVLDNATYNDDAGATTGTVDFTTPNLVWSGSVPAGGTETITYSVTVDGVVADEQTLSGTVTSTSVATSNNCVADSTDPRCTSTVPIAALLIEQHYTEASTTPGSVIHLTGTFTNTGAVDYEGITVSASSADTTDDATPDGNQTATSGTLVLTATGIVWTGDIPVGETVTVTGTLTVKNPDPGNKLVTGTLVSTALGNTCPPAGTDSRCTAAVPVLLPGLTITKTANVPFVVPGSSAVYTITVTNTGQTPYQGATFTDSLIGVLDDASYNDDATATVGTVAFDTPVLSWEGDLAVGQSALITYSTSALNPATGDKIMINAVSSADVGSTCTPASSNAACRVTTAVLTPALTITSATDASSTQPGATVTYTIVATNTGQVAYPPADLTVDLGGVLSNAVLTTAAAATSGSVTVSDETLSWTGTLAVGASTTITYAVTVVDQPSGTYRLEQTVVSADIGNNCQLTATDPRCSTSVPIASLELVNSVDVATAKPTDVIRYTGTFINTGQVPYTDVTISDSFVGALDDAVYNGDATADSGSLILVAGSGKVVWTGTIDVGQTVTVTGSVTVIDPPAGDGVVSTVFSTDAIANNCPVGSADARCTTSVTVLLPALTISTTADTSTAAPGSLVTYTTTARNTGQTPYTAASVTIALNGALDDGIYESGTADRGALVLTGPTLRWTGDLGVGDEVVITHVIRVDDPDPGDREMVTSVSSTELGNTCRPGGGGATCSNIVTVLVPGLELSVVADMTTTMPGASVGYTVTISNTGQTDYVGAEVAVLLAGALDDTAAPSTASTTASRGTVVFVAAESTLAWTGNLAVGQSATIVYALVVDDPDLGNLTLTTTVASAEPGTVCSVDGCTSTVAVLVPGLAIDIAASETTTAPGSRVVFTITVANVGQTAYPAATVHASLAGVVDDGRIDGATNATVGVAQVVDGDVTWTGGLLVGQTAVITFAAIVDDPDEGDRVLTSAVVGEDAGSTCSPSSTDPSCTVSVAVLVPQLTIIKTADAATVTPGESMGYTIVITNTGETFYTAAVVSDSLAGVLTDAVYGGDATASSGTLQFASPVLSWTGDLAIGASATIRYSITVDDPDLGDKAMTNSVESSAPGSTCPPGSTTSACLTVVQVLVPALAITKASDVTSVAAGEIVTYTVTLTNTGETDYAPATFVDSLTEVLDDASYNGDAVATSGDVAYSGGAQALSWTGAVAMGDTVTVSYSVTALFPAGGDRTLTNAVASAAPGASCATTTEPGCSTTVTVLVPALSVSKTADSSAVVAGGELRYTIQATNTGEVDYPAAELADDLSGVLTNAVYNADATSSLGSLSLDGSTLKWSGLLVRGATVTITYSVTADLSASDTAVLVNSVSSTSLGSTCLGGEATAPCSVSVPVAARTISLSGLTEGFTLSGMPNTTVTSNGAVTMTVTTNSAGGYVVSVQSQGSALTGADPANPDIIPITDLAVRGSGDTVFVPLSPAPIVVGNQNSATPPSGDAVSNDFRVDIPFVSGDTYTGTLDYIVSAQ
ncbi:putative Ig domain-containing protein [Herbiconiux sp. CPCC 205763]|uniref:Ig domain-containing protein n=1 Tax=Herbiconiux aconitum TaxID=2970913 RepID=A0ABT2GVY7_9MICO|nr:putative Ig domain-containing protein [Herbiconiux aconitum]MCS5719732.1 putative Ig domain-containing protein [Herbiconiux aconitum]